MIIGVYHVERMGQRVQYVLQELLLFLNILFRPFPPLFLFQGVQGKGDVVGHLGKKDMFVLFGNEIIGNGYRENSIGLPVVFEFYAHDGSDLVLPG